LQKGRKRPQQAGREHFAILSDPNETGTAIGGGALDVETSIFEMHTASEQRASLIGLMMHVDKT